MSYVLRGFGSDFDRTLRLALQEIKSRGKDQEEKFKMDKDLILERLLTSFTPLPVNHVFDEDFLVGAVDGSGVAPLLQYEDVLVHLVTANLSLYATNSQEGEPLKGVRIVNVPPLPDDGRLTEAFWIAMDERQKEEHFLKYIKRVYKIDDGDSILYPYFSEIKGEPITSIRDLQRYSKLSRITSVEDVVIFPPASSTQRVYDHIRWIAEAALAKRALQSELQLKYLFLDGALTLLIPEGREYPILAPNFMVRDVCSRARRKGVIVAGVSKSHTIPCWGLIADLARFRFGVGSHWFCRLPGEEGPEKRKLRILEGRRQIPPKNAVTYIFRFSEDMPVLRVDFDRIWWQENVLEDDIKEMKMKETKIFQEIDFLSHDARWYGYPCPLAFAHQRCTIAGEGRELLVEQAVSIAKREGFDEEKLIPARRRIGIGE